MIYDNEVEILLVRTI